MRTYNLNFTFTSETLFTSLTAMKIRVSTNAFKEAFKSIN